MLEWGWCVTHSNPHTHLHEALAVACAAVALAGGHEGHLGQLRAEHPAGPGAGQAQGLRVKGVSTGPSRPRLHHRTAQDTVIQGSGVANIRCAARV